MPHYITTVNSAPVSAARDLLYLASMMSFSLLVIASSIILSLWKWFRKSHNLPGPPGYLLLGNLLDMPRADVSQRFAHWREVSHFVSKISCHLNVSLRNMVQIIFVTLVSLLMPYTNIGDVVYLSVFNQGIVILNSQKAAMEILGNKGETSAGRPILTMASELCVFPHLSCGSAQFKTF